MTKYHFAVVGATGNIGHVLTEELLKKGHKVNALGRDAQKLKDLKAKGAEVFSGDFTEHHHLAKAFKGCHAVFSFIPPGYFADDSEVFRERIGESIAHAIFKEKISHVVNLSSIGAQLSSGTGPIKELHLHEQRLNAVPNLNVIHLRAAFFMENLLSFIPLIKNAGIISSAINADLPIPMVATLDIAHKAADLLTGLNFTGSSIFEFVGPQAVTMHQVANMIGKAIAKPDLKYVHISYAEAEKALIASGMKHQMAKLMVEMHQALNEGKIKPTQQLTAEHKGKTTFEEFSHIFSKMMHPTRKKAA